jgi:hypothetical protein
MIIYPESTVICKLYCQGKSAFEIAEQLHLSSTQVSKILRANNIWVWVPGTRHFTDSEEAEIAKIYKAGFSARAIARAYHLPGKQAIMGALRRQKVIQRSPAERNRLYKLNPHKFDAIDHEHKAYWLGFLYADGNVYRERTLKLSLKVADIRHVEKLRDFLESESPVKTIQQKCAGKYYPQARVEFTDQHLAARLMNLGIVKGRPNFHPAIDSMPISLHSHFLRGFWDGDGGASRNPGSGINFCGHEDFLIWIRAYMSEHAGTNPNLKVSKHVTANLYYLVHSGRLQALKVFTVLFQDATVWLERKRERIESWPPIKPRSGKKKGQFIKNWHFLASIGEPYRL